MGKALCRHARARRLGRGAGALIVAAALGWAPGLPVTPPAAAQGIPGLQLFTRGRLTIAAAPHDAALARSLLASALARDTFPWLPRPRASVLIVIAPDRRAFRELVGPRAPEYGSAIAIPSERRIIMQGSRASSAAWDPIQVLRHELAHLALHEALGSLPSRWFDEGYASFAAAEWGREEVLSANVVLAIRGMPSLEALEASFSGGAARATAAYALAQRAVVELAALDPSRGLGLFFRYWRDGESFDGAVRRAFGVTAAQFEQRWRTQTRRRYGALALFADLTLGALVLLAVVAPLYVSRRRRDRQRLEAMMRSEADAERRERQSAIEALLRSVAPPGPEGRPPGGVA